MSTQQDYTVVTQRHGSTWSDALQEAVYGWTIRVHDSVTGMIVPVFVPDAKYTVDGTRTMIEAALAPVRAIAQLGSAPPQA